MTEAFVKLHLFLVRHRWGVLVLVCGFAVCAALLSRRLKLNEDFTDMLPMSEPAIAEQVEALKHIRQADRLYVDVQTATLDSARLGEAADQMDAALREIPELGDVRYRVEAADLRDVYEQLQEQLPTLLSADDLRGLEPRLEPAAVEERLAWLKKAMSQPQGLMFKDVARTDPVGLGDIVSARVRALQAGAGDAGIVSGRITSADGRHALISATPAFKSSEVQKCATLMDRVLRAARSVEARFPDGTVRIAITGAHRSALDNATMIREDTERTSVVATVAVVILMVAAFRRRWLAFLGLLPTVFGVLCALLVFFLTGDPVSAVALGCGSILIGVTVDYGIYVLYRADGYRPRNHEELARGVAQLAPALTFGALTTMAAFFVMFFSPVSGHRQLGWFGAIGVAMAAVFALVVLPLLIPLGRGGGRPVCRRGPASRRPDPRDTIPEPANMRESALLRAGEEEEERARAGEVTQSLPLTSLMRRLFDWRARRARLVLPLLLLVTVICIAGIWRLRFDGDFARLNGVTVETRQDEEAIREAWGKALSLTTVVVAGADRETVLQQNEQVCAVLQTLQERQHIDTFSSIAPLMPSDRERANHLRAWRSFWTPSRQGALSNSLTRAAASLGFRTGAFDGFLERIRSPRSAVTGMESGLGRLAADFWSEQAGRVFISTLVKARDRESFRELRAAVQREVPGAMLLNKQALSDEVTRIARGALPLFGVLVALLNALLLYLLLGRIELAAITLLPVATGVFWTLGSLGLLGLPVDMSNFIFVVFVVGVGGDYSLFLVLAELEPLRGHQQRAASTGGAVTICAFTTLLGVGVLVLARHPALFSVGLTALLGISFSLLATLFLVPPCMRRVGMRCHASGTPRGASPPGVQATGGTMTLSVSAKRNLVGRFYRYQGPYVTQFVFWKMKTDPLFTAVETTVPLRGEILDLGCGYGIVAHWLTAFDGERTVRGVDFDAEKVRVAAATALANPRVSFERRDILEWPQYPACDCVLLCDVLHYFPREWKAAVLRKAFQALRPGGRLIVRDAFASQTSAHSRVAWAERWAVRLGQNKTRHGLHFESEETHLALLREAGFEGVETRKDAGLGSNRLITAAKCAG